MNKLVSAIITTHNRKTELLQALGSVLNQTYTPLEVIVVDDKSDDGTREYMEEYVRRNPSVQYIYIPEDESQGGNYARNKGIQRSKGEYIALLDDDDLWLPHKTELQVQLLDQQPELGFVYCNWFHRYDDNKKYASRLDPGYQGDLREKCFEKIFCTTSTMMFRRDKIFAAGLFDNSLRFWQEYDLTIRMAGIAPIGFVNQPLAEIKISFSDSNRLTNKYDGWREAVGIINEKYKDRIKELPVETNRLRKSMIARDAAMRLYHIGDKQKCRKYLKVVWQLTGSYRDWLHYFLNYPYSLKDLLRK